MGSNVCQKEDGEASPLQFAKFLGGRMPRGPITPEEEALMGRYVGSAQLWCRLGEELEV